MVWSASCETARSLDGTVTHAALVYVTQFTCITVTSKNMSDNGRSSQRHPGIHEMTVAHIREPAGADHVDVVFLESARFYRLNRENPNFERALGLLRETMEKGGIVEVELASPHGELINEVRKLHPDSPGSEVQNDKEQG